MADSKIEWTDKTWNPTRGCTRVSRGCENCYAERQAYRFSRKVQPYAGLVTIANGHPQWTGKVVCDESKLDEPLHWRKPCRIFVDSMSDLFHEDVPFDFIDRVFAVMASRSRHAFQILTKRPGRMASYFKRIAELAPAAGEDYEARMRAHFEKYKDQFQEGYSLPSPPTQELRVIYDSACKQENRKLLPDGTTLWEKGFSGGEYHWRPWPLPNVWLGVSVEDQKTADERIPLLLQMPAAVRWVSYEPALSPIDFGPYLKVWSDIHGTHRVQAEKGDGFEKPQLDWLVIGGESGPGARPFNLQWARDVVAQCKAAGVPVFVKQLGRFPFDVNGNANPERWQYNASTHLRLKDRKGGDMSEFPFDLRIREYPREAKSVRAVEE